MAALSLERKNAEKRKIPNPSLTGVTSVFSPQKRRKLEFSGVIHYNNSTEAFVPPRQPCGCIPMRLFTYLQFYGAIDMYDKSMIAQLLPSEMIIKNYIHGDPDCNYERYLLEFVNASDFFRTKSGGDIYQSPESEENGQCDCISTSYQLDFKLIASKTALQAKSILYPSKAEIVKGVFVTSEPKVKNGSIKATRIHAALREYDFEGLQKLRTTTIKKQGVENDIIELLKTLETRKHLLLFFPYKLICKTDSKLKWFIDQQYNAFGVKRYDSVVKFMANIYTDDEGGIHLSGVNRVLAGKSTNSAISYARAIQRLLSEEGLIRYNDTYRYMSG